jgi:ABC-type amino acid transport substrate-binding protein
MDLGFEIEIEYPKEMIQTKPLPPGEHMVEILYIGSKPTRSGGWMLNMKLGNDHGHVWDNFNIGHASESTRQSAQKKLARLARCSGLEGSFSNTDDLLNRSVAVELGTNQNGYTEVLKYKEKLSLVSVPDDDDDEPEF